MGQAGGQDERYAVGRDEEAGVGRRWVWVVGPLMVVLGAVWMFQGLGYLEGSFMTGSGFWTVAGMVVAGAGVVLLVVQRDRH